MKQHFIPRAVANVLTSSVPANIRIENPPILAPVDTTVNPDADPSLSLKL